MKQMILILLAALLFLSGSAAENSRQALPSLTKRLPITGP